MNLTDIALRIKRGVKLLDRKVPRWRTVLRVHEDQFDFRDGDHCVLGTLEHFSGQMRVLGKKAASQEDHTFDRALARLGVANDSDYYGFDGAVGDWNAGDDDYHNELDTLDALWRAEFVKD
jgi:hypothetical protein